MIYIMDFYSSEKWTIKIISLIGAIQGLAWVGMSLAAIIVFLGKYEPDFQETYFDGVKSLLYTFYFAGDGAKVFPKQTLSSTIFTVLMWFHLIMNSFWLFTSVYAFFYKKESNPFRLVLWSCTTLATCSLDLVSVIILAIDYDSCLTYVDKREDTIQSSAEEACSLAILIPLVIAARGFTLWILNVFLSLHFGTLHHKAKEMLRAPKFRPQTIQNMYPNWSQNNLVSNKEEKKIYLF